MIRAAAIAVLILASVPAPAATSAAADDAFRDAKSSYEKLKSDPRRRTLRHHWQNVAKKFEAIAKKYPKSDRAPEALFNAGRLNNELSRISQKDEDTDAAARAYQKLIAGWPKHKLADDAALSLAKLLADRKNDGVGARKVLEAALPGAGDMKGLMNGMLAELPKAPEKRAEKSKRDEVTVPKVVASKDKPKKEVARVKVEVSDDDEPGAPSRAKSKRVPDEEIAQVGEMTPSSDVADAIRKALKPVEKPAPVAQARRMPVARAEEDTDEVVEEAEPVVASLSERLRDFRVGARQPGAADSETKTRFKQFAKDQAASDLTLAQQLGLKVKRVIIDAGHGGHDTGAIGKGGTREKDVALSIAKKLAAKLEAAGLEVVMTRDDDTFVKLEDRTRIANRQKGDLFISVHCNSAPTNKLRGIETYTLNTSSNRYSIRLAARENATTERGVGDLQYILADLATKANTGESSLLANRVQQGLIRNLSADYKDVKNLGTKEALFFVLLGAKMPAILVETSFLSHPDEEVRLADDAYQTKVAASISEAVEGFLEERNKLAQLD